MQLYALDENKKLIFAKQASRHVDYSCLECGNTLHLRGGFHRQNHFYHLETIRNCKQNGKTLEHLQTQLYFLKHLPENDCQLEKRFPEIQRIADVVWLSKKIVFEIQCSPITVQEVQERNRDYRKLGFEVVWILHDKRYNRDWMSGAEEFLHTLPHYFTNMSQDGEGVIYDQFSVVETRRRMHRLGPLAVDCSAPKYVNKALLSWNAITLECVKERLQRNMFYFSGDLVDCALNKVQNEYILAAKEIESVRKIATGSYYLAYLKKLLDKFVIRPFHLLLQLFLERACR